MRKSTIGWLMGLGLLGLVGAGLATRADAQERGPGRGAGRLGIMQNYAARWDRSAPQVAPGETLAYGPAPQQRLEFWPARHRADPSRAPLLLYVHGGGWARGSKDNATGRWKEAHFPQAGFAFASIDYRLVPQARVEDEAADVAHALAKVIADADRLGIDRHRVVLVGHSAGAHLVALVGSDERYLREAGLSFADLAGVIAIDGAAYDVPAQFRDGPAIMQQTYGEAFGTDPARQAALSPTLQAAAPNARQFLLLHVQRPDGVRQSEALARALEAGGSKVEVAGFPGQGLLGHMEINRRLGDPDYPATKTVDDWLKAVVG
ncbi:MAG: alpha/beta hydrolase [Sphingomonadales bacterium]|nr:alpha/beta hydrolase [Sphingomonadales bacterium]